MVLWLAKLVSLCFVGDLFISKSHGTVQRDSEQLNGLAGLAELE